MNGAHDMGGMQTFGPVRPDQDEAVFHAPWEGRITAIWSAAAASGKWNTDFGRQVRESIPAPDYLALNHFQMRYVHIVELMVAAGMITRDELASGQPAKGTQKAVPALTADNVAAWFANGNSKRRTGDVAAQFRVGQPVRTRNINPLTHTRLPRYARDKVGSIERDHGVFVFPDSNAQGLGEKPQHVYSVRFSARELWGEHAHPKDTVVLNLWDDYLEAVSRSA